MACKWIIAIGREYCSGGADTGRLVAERLGVPYYDREIIDRSANLLRVNSEVVEVHEERPTSFWSVGDYQYEAPWYTSDPALVLPMGIKVAEAQFETIRQCAAEGPCVIVGRCADYVLRENPRLISVFIRASRASRVERLMRLHEYSRSEAEKRIDRADKIRTKYYRSHTDRDWGDPKCHDLVLDTSRIGAELAAELIVCYAEGLSRSEAARI